MQVFRPYLALNNAKEAIEYYKNVFDGEVLSIKYGDEIPGQEELRGSKRYCYPLWDKNYGRANVCIRSSTK